MQYAGYDRPLTQQPFAMEKDEDYHWIKAAIDAQKAGGWTLFDLRQLRFKHLEMSEDWERVVYGYDLMVMIPEISPAELVH